MFVLYDGAHYDPLVLIDNSECDNTDSNSGDNTAHSFVRTFAVNNAHDASPEM